MRKVENTLRDSVYMQMLWAVDILGLQQYFRAMVSPLKLVYIPTGQTVIFRGADEPAKLKSIKPPFGYFRYIWFEEWNQFHGMEETRNVLQSLMRGGEKFSVFYSYNPPQSQRNWVNEEVRVSYPDRIVHHSTYKEVPPAWLGGAFLLEAGHLEQVQPERYAHEYLGEVTGTGGEVFRNVTLRKITDAEVGDFDRIRRGLDWGYAVDPFAYVKCHHDKTRRRLYIFREIYAAGMSNREAARRIRDIGGDDGIIRADSAEPKSIAEMNNEHGLRVIPARKGPDSVKYGVEWLCNLEEIVIDDERCPNTAREFLGYELDIDKNGNFKAEYPDRDNHCIDGVRYATEDDQINVRVR